MNDPTEYAESKLEFLEDEVKYLNAELARLRTERDTWQVPLNEWPEEADGYYMVRVWTRWNRGSNTIVRQDVTKLSEIKPIVSEEDSDE